MNPLVLARMMLIPPRRYLGQPIVVCPRCKERVPNYWMMGKALDDNCGTCEGELNHGSSLPDEVKAKIRSDIVDDEWFSETAVCNDCGETFTKDPNLWLMRQCSECFSKDAHAKQHETIEWQFDGLFSSEKKDGTP